MTTPLSEEKLADIRGNIRIYDNRVAERDVSALLKEIERLKSALMEAELAAEDGAFECERCGQSMEADCRYCDECLEEDDSENEGL